MNHWSAVLAAVEAVHARVEAATVAKTIALAGAGFHGQAAAAWWRAQGATLACFVDNNPSKQGKPFAGLAVVSIDQLAARKVEFVLITARHAVRSVEAQLTAAGIACLSYDAFFIARHLPRLRQIRDRLADDRSREVLDHLLLAMVTGDAGHCRAVSEPNQYFALPQFIPSAQEHFVDAGAYVGDTIERFLWAGNGVYTQIHAFEPGAAQYAAMHARMERLQREWALSEASYHCVNAAVGEEEGTVQFHTAGILQSSSIAEGPAVTTVPARTLDGYLAGNPITLLKADIEGMELPMLRGATASIKQHRPKLAISLYHRIEDLIEIPEYIHALGAGYQFSLRHHSPSLMETVLYAWVEA